MVTAVHRTSLRPWCAGSVGAECLTLGLGHLGTALVPTSRGGEAAGGQGGEGGGEIEVPGVTGEGALGKGG